MLKLTENLIYRLHISMILSMVPVLIFAVLASTNKSVFRIVRQNFKVNIFANLEKATVQPSRKARTATNKAMQSKFIVRLIVSQP